MKETWILRVESVGLSNHVTMKLWPLHLSRDQGIDDGIRLEPFNMRREMREGHFDESGFYVLNKDMMS